MRNAALEHCKKLAGEKSYLIELLKDGWKPSAKEERNVNTEEVLVDPLLQQAVRVLLEDDRRWTCVEIFRELGIAASTVHTILSGPCTERFLVSSIVQKNCFRFV